MIKEFAMSRNDKVDWKNYDPEYTAGIKNKVDVAEDFDKLKLKLEEHQDILFAEKKHSVLVILQGMDCSGKDGVVKNVMSQVNPNGLQIANFKNPSAEESSHDFLWRAHKQIPAKGYIAVFNRSYYEDVLITRVHKLISDREAERRFRHINNFETLLKDNHVTIIKIFLNISKEYQIKKIKDRLKEPHKKWKFDKNDLMERDYWDEYHAAYEDIFRECNKKSSPWYIVPANNRWFRDYLVLKIIVNALEKLDLSYPEPDLELESMMMDAVKK